MMKSPLPPFAKGGVDVGVSSTAKEDKLDKIAERVYNASFVITVLLILGASIGTAVIRYISNDSKIELVSDNVFKFIEHILWIFALPVSVKIIGDRLPLVVQALQAWRGGGYGQTGFGQSGYGIQSSFGINQFGNTTTYPPTGDGANSNTYY